MAPLVRNSTQKLVKGPNGDQMGSILTLDRIRFGFNYGPKWFKGVFISLGLNEKSSYTFSDRAHRALSPMLDWGLRFFLAWKLFRF